MKVDVAMIIAAIVRLLVPSNCAVRHSSIVAHQPVLNVEMNPVVSRMAGMPAFLSFLAVD
jgi:hypothetical protein